MGHREETGQKNPAGSHSNPRYQAPSRRTDRSTKGAHPWLAPRTRAPFLAGPHRHMPTGQFCLHVSGRRTHHTGKHQQPLSDTVSHHVQDVFTVGSTNRRLMQDGHWNRLLSPDPRLQSQSPCYCLANQHLRPQGHLLPLFVPLQ